MTSVSLGASAVCIFTGCGGHKITLGMIFVLSLLTLIFGSMIHNKCSEARKYTGMIIAFSVLLLVGICGYYLMDSGIINIPDKLKSKSNTESLFNYEDYNL